MWMRSFEKDSEHVHTWQSNHSYDLQLESPNISHIAKTT